MPYHTVPIPSTVGSAETGEIRIWAGAAADIPDGYLLCDGSAVSRTQYTALYQTIGDTYGAGDGSTTFNLPDLRDAFPMGASTTSPIGTTGGEAAHTLIIDELPRHNHPIVLTQAQAASGNFICSNNGQGAANTPQASLSQYVGSDKPHNNLPPFVAINFIIKT